MSNSGIAEQLDSVQPDEEQDQAQQARSAEMRRLGALGNEARRQRRDQPKRTAAAIAIAALRDIALNAGGDVVVKQT